MHNTDFVASPKNDFDKEERMDSPKRRRTVDDEGFVTPTTPDIPRSSTYHQAQGGDEQYTSVNSDGDEFFDNDFLTSYQSFSSSPGTRQKSSDTEPQGEDDRASQFTSRDIPQNESQQPEMTSPSPRTNDDDSEREDSQESCQHIYDDLSIADLIKDMSEKSMKVYMHWMELFRDGEKFEEGVPSLIDELLNHARHIEADLVKQKECLRQRLHSVTQTLRVDRL
uniref:Uncharacterized protein LOC111101176 n=1 Tax=Crassostrea virginica TaxID=6565 RepID=A0A8B8ADM2_CRAVI|nr:uncharacterized protein LOC111101176 [Crassostrea virginica]